MRYTAESFGRFFLVFTAFFFFASQRIVAQQAAVDTIASASGTCSKVIVDGTANNCAKGQTTDEAGLFFAHLSNGISIFTVPLGTGGIFNFVGGADSQPNPSQYVLYLSSVRLTTDQTSVVANVSGTCTLVMNVVGNIWYSLVCEATGEKYSKYELDFISDGTQITVSHPNQTSQNSGGHDAAKISGEMIKTVTSEFKSSLSDGGMALVTKNIQGCYDKTSFSETVSNELAVMTCSLFDISAFNFDKAWRTNLIARGFNDPGPVSPYLSPQSFRARMEIYSPIWFNGSVDAAQSYLSHAASLVIGGVV